MNFYRGWDFVGGESSFSIETEIVVCDNCSTEIEVTPHIVRGFLCPFDEEPPNDDNDAELVRWITKAARVNHGRWMINRYFICGLRSLLSLHIDDLDGKEQPFGRELTEYHMSQDGVPAMDKNSTSEEVVRRMLDTIRKFDL